MLAANRIDAQHGLIPSAQGAALCLFTGDNGTMVHDELSAMLDYAAARKFPRNAIVADYAGFNTYDSCYRAKRVFGVRFNRARNAGVSSPARDLLMPFHGYRFRGRGVALIGKSTSYE